MENIQDPLHKLRETATDDELKQVIKQHAHSLGTAHESEYTESKDRLLSMITVTIQDLCRNQTPRGTADRLVEHILKGLLSNAQKLQDARDDKFPSSLKKLEIKQLYMIKLEWLKSHHSYILKDAGAGARKKTEETSRHRTSLSYDGSIDEITSIREDSCQEHLAIVPADYRDLGTKAWNFMPNSAAENSMTKIQSEIDQNMRTSIAEKIKNVMKNKDQSNTALADKLADLCYQGVEGQE